MSTFFAEVITCPHCGKTAERSVAHSINATRAPHYRQAILRGEFQNYTCKNCKQTYMVDRPFVYFDYDSNDWLAIFPIRIEKKWREYENSLSGTLNMVFGPDAPLIARSLISGMKVRTVFGLLALREKLLCIESGLDDIILELLKFRLLTSGGVVLSKEMRPRLMDVTEDTLVFVAPTANGEAESELGLISLERAAYDEVVAGREDWTEMIEELSKGSYVDIGRLLF